MEKKKEEEKKKQHGQIGRSNGSKQRRCRHSCLETECSYGYGGGRSCARFVEDGRVKEGNVLMQRG